MKVLLRRFLRKNTSVFGMLKFEDFTIFTLENFMKIIPAGNYPVSLEVSPRFSYKLPYKYYDGVPLINQVPGRSGIRIHVANYAHELQGCVAVGKAIDIEKPMLNNSRFAYVKMMNYLRDNKITEIDLEITDDYA